MSPAVAGIAVFFFPAEDGIRDKLVTGVQTCALPILEKKDAVKAGQLLKASHKGLRYDYEVSSEELDHIADFANKFEGVHGARMMGGGFGGCVLVLVNEKTSNEFVTENADNYFMKYNSEPEVINFELGSGVEIV